MKKSTFISVLALLIAAVGAVIAVLAYFGKKKCVLCDDFDDFDDDFMAEEPNDIEYFASEMEADEPSEQAPTESTENKKDMGEEEPEN